MRTVNRVFLIGRLGQDPEIRMGKAGRSWCSFSLATNRSRRESDGSYSDDTDWHAVRVFGDRADQCHKFLRRGSMVAIEGSMVYEKWTDDEGKRRTFTRVLGDRVTFLSNLRPREGEDIVDEESEEVERSPIEAVA